MNRPYKTWSTLALLVLSGLALSGCTLLSPSLEPASAAQHNSTPAVSAMPPTPVLPGDFYPEETMLAALYRQVNPSVVHIRVVKQSAGLSDIPSMPQLPGPPGAPMPYGPGPGFPSPSPQQGEGSGFVWDTQGHLVTNHHVIQDARVIEATFADDTTVEAELVGSDPHSDIAVLRVDPQKVNLRPVVLGDSDALIVGQFAIAIGNPFGQVGTMTSGIISALGRTFRASSSQFSITEMIQTDASINPGNSGGPLLDSKGRVIGINTLILSQTGTSAGVGFAIPINTAKKVVPSLIETGSYEYALLGITGTDLSLSTARAMNLPEGTRGALITEVSPDSPAESAGLLGSTSQVQINGFPVAVGGDVIIGIDGHPVKKMADVLDYLAQKTRPGQTITITILRAGQQMDIAVTLGTR